MQVIQVAECMKSAGFILECFFGWFSSHFERRRSDYGQCFKKTDHDFLGNSPGAHFLMEEPVAAVSFHCQLPSKQHTRALRSFCL